MASYEFLNYKWGSAFFGASGGQVTWSFASTVGDLISFDYQISEIAYQNLIRNAFAAWEAVANIDFVEVSDSYSVDIRLGWDYIDGAGGTLAHTKSQYQILNSYNKLQQAEIAFDTSEDWTTNPNAGAAFDNFYTTALHEIGHAIGLDHNDDINTIMYAYSNDVLALSAGDIQGIHLLYGQKAGGSGSTTGTSGPDNWFGTAGNDVYNGGYGNDTMHGLAGNDTLTGGPGNDYIDGGSGLDTAVFSGPGGDYTYAFGPGGQITVTDKFTGSASDGVDTLLNIERLSFTNGVLAFDIDGNAGQSYRLYQAAFDRVPDVGGLGYWIDQKDAGMALLTIAGHFIGSNEFKALYGTNPSNTTFIDLLYQNVMNRLPDAGGYSYWLGQMSGGMSKAQVLVNFSESAENKANVLPAIDDGIWYV